MRRCDKCGRPKAMVRIIVEGGEEKVVVLCDLCWVLIPASAKASPARQAEIEREADELVLV